MIIYDALSCPNLFVEQSCNQALPVEGVYAVIEVKTQLNHSKLEECFENLQSLKILGDGTNVSTNGHVRIIAPLGCVIAFADKRALLEPSTTIMSD